MSVDLAARIIPTLDQIRVDRLDQFHTAWTAYSGDAPLPLKIKEGDPDDNVRLNFARKLVDVSATFLFGQPLVWEVEGEGDDQKRLREFYDELGGTGLRKLAKNGAITGHAFVKLYPPADGGLPRAIIQDPSNCEPVFDDEDIDKLVGFTIQWNRLDRETGKAVVRRQRFVPSDGTGKAPSSWEIVDEVSDESGDRWRELDSNHHPYPWIPIFHCQHLEAPNEFWGSPELEPDVLDLIASLEKVASDMKRICRLHGHPLIYVTGASANEIETFDASIDAITAIKGSAELPVKVGQLEMLSQLEGPIKLWKELKSAFHELTDYPEVAAGKVENVGAASSGLALKVLYGPRLRRNDELRDSYGRMLRNLGARALEFMGLGADKRPTITWPEVVPESPIEEAMAFEADQRMGIVSRQTIAEKRGYTWKVEAERIADEKGKLGPTPSDQQLVPDPLGVMFGGSQTNGEVA